MTFYDPFKAQRQDDSFYKAALKPTPRFGQQKTRKENTMTTILPHFIEKVAGAGNGGGLAAAPLKQAETKMGQTTAEKNANKNAISCPPTFNKG